jgi:hypothetical protein
MERRYIETHPCILGAVSKSTRNAQCDSGVRWLVEHCMLELRIDIQQNTRLSWKLRTMSKGERAGCDLFRSKLLCQEEVTETS